MTNINRSLRKRRNKLNSKEGPDFLDNYLEDILPGAILEDQYTSYAFGPQTPILPGTLYEHWSKESAIPTMRQMAYDSAPHRPYKKPGLGWPGYQAVGTLRPGRPGGARPNA
jgi:hypothetical protein